MSFEKPESFEAWFIEQIKTVSPFGAEAAATDEAWGMPDDWKKIPSLRNRRQRLYVKIAKAARDFLEIGKGDELSKRSH